LNFELGFPRFFKIAGAPRIDCDPSVIPAIPNADFPINSRLDNGVLFLELSFFMSLCLWFDDRKIKVIQETSFCFESSLFKLV
jgi:hypothetical protein